MTYYMMMKLALGFWTPKTKLRKTLYYNHWSSVVKLLVLHSFKAKPLSRVKQQLGNNIKNSKTIHSSHTKFSLQLAVSIRSVVHYEKSWCMCKIISTYINLMIVHHYSLFTFGFTTNIFWGIQSSMSNTTVHQCLKMASVFFNDSNIRYVAKKPLTKLPPQRHFQPIGCKQ